MGGWAWKGILEWLSCPVWQDGGRVDIVDLSAAPLMSGSQEDFTILEKTWIPAFAGMTKIS
jgi:hypothetical protein